MPRAPILVAVTAALVTACSPAPSPALTEPAATPAASMSAAAPASASPAPSGAVELPGGSGPLTPGTYTRAGFLPRVAFTVGDGWYPGTRGNGFFDIQQDRGTPDVVAVQFGRITGLVGADGTTTTPTTAAAARETIEANPGLDVLARSDSRLGGLTGVNVEVENTSGAHAPILDVPVGRLGIDSGRRLWISLFDTDDGLLAVMVGGSIARWDRALGLAEPVLESIVIDAGAGVPAAEPVEIALGGRGPIGLDVTGDRAWVVLTDSGDLVEVDLAGRRVVRTIPVGTGGSQVVATDDGEVYVGRFDTGGVGEHLAVVDSATGAVRGIDVGPVGGLAIEGSSVWAFLKTGAVTLIDRATGDVLGARTVHVDQDAHMDAVAGAGSVWVSGDRTPVHRISGPEPHLVADIETGGGIPLAFEGGLVWGARPEEVWAIDPGTNTVSRRIPLAAVDEILALAIDGEQAWIAARRPGRIGTVIAIDLASGSVIAETPISLPAGVRLTADRAWVTDYETNRLVGIARP